jgi:hypothetical protein
MPVTLLFRRFTVRGQPWQKVSETPTSTNKPSVVVVHICDPSCTGGIGRRIEAQGKNARSYLKNN